MARPRAATAVPKGHTDVGARIKAARAAAGITQRDLARAVGVGRRAVQAWEAGEYGITWPNLRAIAEKLDVSEDWLLLGPEGMSDLAVRIAEARDRPVEAVVAEILERVRHLEVLLAAIMAQEGSDDAVIALTRRTRRLLGEPAGPVGGEGPSEADS